MDTDTAPRAGRREWAGLAALALPTLLASLELTLPNLALPAIAADLAPSGAQSLWIIDIYGFLLAGSLITMGTLGDRIGRRRMLLAGSAAFGVASVLAAYSVNAEMLIAARALLGIAGATLMPSSLSLAATIFRDPRQRTVAIGIVIACVAGGTAIGPLAGGWILQHFRWGAVFLIAAPVIVIFLVVGPLLLPEHKEPDAGKMDVLSVVMSLVAVLTVIYGLKRTAEHGVGTIAVVSIVVGLISAVVFVRRQRCLKDPLIDLRLLRSASFSVSLVTLLLGVFVLFGANFYLAQYLQLVFGLSPLHAGLWTAPAACGVIVGSTLAPVLVRRVRPGLVVGAGLLVSAAGFLVLTQVSPGGGLPTLVAGSVVVSAGLGPMMTLTTDLVVGCAPPGRAGEASALAETAPELGGALGIAILGSIGTAVYNGMTVPAGLTPDAAETARGTLSGAVSVAAQSPHPVGAELLDAARGAFTDGLHLIAGISTALLVVTATLFAFLVRRS
ncbi:MFS transporter [Kibdelosporangium phytohabitans]|uniref:MFS transporter n=1 Tax=Kibdelosporangium phytohabitans TaxID=860235 RepID=A0A0N7F3Q4_9PSEU|nr:MFS transporter [Kibdelosporangium phytohabitans]ALG09279.1 MFS transporter [Kibdelosporangium phytohabitans]MBE1469473.1 DHA2 family multidrug resistance protein-like MFS transporter [Kibdelosporangium phytohabitans]